MKIPDDPFGVKVVVGGAVELVKARWLPELAARGEARAALVKARGEFEVRKLENQFKVVDLAEQKIRERELNPQPVEDDLLFSVLEESGRTSDETLHNLWSELLVSASTQTKDKSRTLTSVSILRQLSPKDAALITNLLQLIPPSTLKTQVTLFQLNTGWKTKTIENESEFGEISCIGDFYPEAGEAKHFEVKFKFKNWEENEEFVFGLRNIERVGLIHRSKDKKYPLSALLEQFNFTIIGIAFLERVGLIFHNNLSFSNLEFLETLK